MEVLRGNQSGSKHSRRRSDKISLGENRALDWSIQDSDITLQPHSPLALAEVLCNQGGFLDLIPYDQADKSDDPDLETDETDETWVTSPTAHPSPSASPSADSASRRHKRGPRQRFNLLTCHREPDLLTQCKKILVENALIKNKGERQLY